MGNITSYPFQTGTQPSSTPESPNQPITKSTIGEATSSKVTGTIRVDFLTSKPFTTLSNDTKRLLTEVLFSKKLPTKQIKLEGLGSFFAERLTKENGVFIILKINDKKYAFKPIIENDTVTSLDFHHLIDSGNKEVSSGPNKSPTSKPPSQSCDDFSKSKESEREPVLTSANAKLGNIEFLAQEPKDINIGNHVATYQIKELLDGKFPYIEVSIPPFGNVHLRTIRDNEVYFFDNNHNCHNFDSKTGAFIKTDPKNTDPKKEKEPLDLTSQPESKGFFSSITDWMKSMNS